MAKKISDLPAAAALDGTETAELSQTQSSVLTSVKATVTSIRSFIVAALGSSATKDTTGVDAKVVSGTAGVSGNLSEWNSDGDLVDSGSATSDFAATVHTHTMSDVTDAGALATLGVVKDQNIDSETATDAQVLTADGAGSATWESVAGNSVTSVFGRTGVVVAATGDYTAAQVTNAADTTTDIILPNNKYFASEDTLGNAGALIGVNTGNTVNMGDIDNEFGNVRIFSGGGARVVVNTSGGVEVGSPGGGDPGSGILNAEGLQINGSPVYPRLLDNISATSGTTINSQFVPLSDTEAVYSIDFYASYTGNGTLDFQFTNISGNPETGGGGSYSYSIVEDGAASSSASADSIPLVTSINGDGAFGTIKFYNKSPSANSMCTFNVSARTGASVTSVTGSALYEDTDPLRGIIFTVTGGTIADFRLIARQDSPGV